MNHDRGNGKHVSQPISRAGVAVFLPLEQLARVRTTVMAGGYARPSFLVCWPTLSEWPMMARSHEAIGRTQAD